MKAPLLKHTTIYTACTNTQVSTIPKGTNKPEPNKKSLNHS